MLPGSAVACTPPHLPQETMFFDISGYDLFTAQELYTRVLTLENNQAQSGNINLSEKIDTLTAENNFLKTEIIQLKEEILMLKKEFEILRLEALT